VDSAKQTIGEDIFTKLNLTAHSALLFVIYICALFEKASGIMDRIFSSLNHVFDTDLDKVWSHPSAQHSTSSRLAPGRVPQ
jgi:hypothetical protein